MGDYALFFQGWDKSRYVRAIAAPERTVPPAPNNIRDRIPGRHVDSIETWIQSLMDGANLFNEVNPRSAAATLPVACTVASLCG